MSMQMILKFPTKLEEYFKNFIKILIYVSKCDHHFINFVKLAIVDQNIFIFASLKKNSLKS